MNIPLLDLKRLHAPMRDELVRAFEHTLDSSNFINGPGVTSFEEQLTTHVGVGQAIGVSSGTDALLVAMMALGVGPGDEVITTPYTFFATAGCISRLGARPVFVDIDPVTFNINPKKIEGAITDRTVGIIPVHLFGQCANMTSIGALAEKRDLWVLEDAAQSIGSAHQGAVAGTMGTAATFSFFPAKNLGALGDAGAVVTGDDDLAERMRMLRGHGARQKYFHDMVGGNFRLDALQGALLSVKLSHLVSWEEGRRRVAAGYAEALAEVKGLVLPREMPGDRHVYNQYVVRCDRRDALREGLNKRGIGNAVYYPAPLSVQPCFADLGYAPGDFSVAEQASLETMAIPVDPGLADEQQQVVIDAIREVLS